VRGVGNGLVVPAGPLRMDLRRQLEFVDAVIINGVDPDGADRVAHWFERHTHVPVLRAKPAPFLRNE
jgi:tetraacyldisaccharide-1-P 4'-kinase